MDLETRERERIVEQLLASSGPELAGRTAVSTTWRRHSNDVGRVALDDGRVLMVKVGRFDWAAPRFRAERRAARRLLQRGIVAPRHLRVPERIEGRPVLCYWRIQLPTLSTAWEGRSAEARRGALLEWGRLLRRVHSIPARGCGPLAPESWCQDPVADYLGRDLIERLRPAVAGCWKAGLGALDGAVDSLPELGSRIGDAPTVLLHGDPHAGNVMCRPVNGAGGGQAAADLRCEGLIDLETAAGGPRELDLAHALVLHGPLFAQQLHDGWFDELREGYDHALDPFALRWFAVYHLLNLGFYSALVGDHEHAAAVAEAAAERAAGLGQEA